jgi:hypothetical protein
VGWQKGDALQPESFAHLFAGVSGVVHTLGTLLEDADGTYKRAIRSGDVPGLLGSFLKNVAAGSLGGNPLEKHQQHFEKERSRGTYEVMNRDTGEFHNICFIHPLPYARPIFLCKVDVYDTQDIDVFNCHLSSCMVPECSWGYMTTFLP